MMSKYMMLLICAIVFVSVYSQETARATQNPDGSLDKMSGVRVVFTPSAELKENSQNPLQKRKVMPPKLHTYVAKFSYVYKFIFSRV
jgi:hypothetical protein